MLRAFILAASTLMLATQAQTPTGGNGTITGTVFDAANGRPIPLVQIAIDGIADTRLVTDSDGKYTVALKPGKYKLRFTIENYIETTIDEIEVTADQITDASTVMPLQGAVTTVEVNEKIGAVASTAESMLTERKLAVSVSDGISREDMRAGTATDAAGALEKVTGVSVGESGFVFVRGLGERYSATMLNNAMLPTTEPERRVVPLDLFPTSLIDSIKVLKTYSPDLPGEFSGGLVQLQTVEFPTAKSFSVTVNTGINTATTGQSFNSYRGGGTDAFGFDDGTRQLPGAIPADGRLFVGQYTESEFQEFGRSFPVNYELAPISSMRPTQTYTVAGGNSWGKFGFVGAVTFSNAPQRYGEFRQFLTAGVGNRPQVFSTYNQFDSDNESARIGVVGNLAYRLNATNKFILRNALTRDTDKEGRLYRGLNGGTGNEIEDTRLRFIERRLLSTSIEGDHAVARLGNSILKWQFTYSGSTRDEPDLRETIRGREPGATGAYIYQNLPESGLRFFGNLDDRILEPQGDWSKPFFKGSLSGLFKVGFRGTIRRRDFASRRFRYFPIRAQTIDFTAPTNTILGTENIRPDGMVVREITRGTDSYTASMDIYGGFALVDLNLTSKLRLIGGMRIEDANILVTTIDPLVPGGVPAIAQLSNRDPLPAINVIYALKPRQNLRVGYGRTVNRPDFRELSPFEFTNIVGGYSTAGNPNLLRATIDNLDARWEWFPGGNQVVAASYFFKRFTSPIEQTYTPTASELRQSFINTDSARNQGVELEYRQNLGFYTPRLKALAAQANFTFVDSNVVIPDSQRDILTSLSRPLVGQSRYILNLIGEWVEPRFRSTARFYFNTVSRKITDVGAFNLPDQYQERTAFVDFVYSYSFDEKGRWGLRFSAENMTDNRFLYTQAEFTTRSFQIGRTFSIGTTYNFF